MPKRGASRGRGQAMNAGRGAGGGRGQSGGGRGQGGGGGTTGGAGRAGHGGLGAGGFCLCPKCGYRAPHQPGMPCLDARCPSCNVALVREGSPHHLEIEGHRAASDEKS